jgi:hypothetical protein
MPNVNLSRRQPVSQPLTLKRVLLKLLRLLPEVELLVQFGLYTLFWVGDFGQIDKSYRGFASVYSFFVMAMQTIMALLDLRKLCLDLYKYTPHIPTQNQHVNREALYNSR